MAPITPQAVEAQIDAIYTALVAAEAAHPNSPELKTLHDRLYEARQMAVQHFELEPTIGQRSGGGEKTDPVVTQN
ncbi:hypothetical protein KIKIMORA_01430 [Brevundimonas phage vB_BpoS-Kikimora]|uniref:Uncharacterized protein n=1 Tax=Brevundimonas phage vB_BpoS-Kikimora TaxID=2948601 RepID=A0A9E7MSI4_9CAUD|nr:hypothetical protein KIKIMORA_01430 [Brevundimonas phage vB_BpoS-Kikimora]